MFIGLWLGTKPTYFDINTLIESNRWGKGKGRYNSIRPYVREFPALAFGELCKGIDLRVVEDVVSIWCGYPGCAFFQRRCTRYVFAEFEAIPLRTFSFVSPRRG